MLPFLIAVLAQAGDPSAAPIDPAAASAEADVVDQGSDASNPSGVQSDIVVTASLSPVTRSRSPATVTIIEPMRIDALGEPLVVDLLRLIPSVSVASNGPPGSFAQVRIRGAEANHTLLLIDGIRFNDPASGNAARFELLSGDGIGRIELARGPQSALYGAEAIGGVVLARTGRSGPGRGATASIEAGGKGFRRISGSGDFASSRAGFGVYGGYQESDGIDSLAQGGSGRSAGGERDGYDNLTFGATARAGNADGLSAAAAARFTEAVSEFDGNDPETFARADTLDATRNRIGAGRASISYGAANAPFHAEVGASLLGSTNRNSLAGDPLNKTSGRRTTADALVSGGITTGPVEHRLIVAGDYEHERFVARDQVFFGGTDQRRTRDRGAIVGELRSSFGDRVTADIAVRHDSFEGFRDATTVRGGLVARVAGPVSVFVGYGTGIARPTFFDLFGFFPGSFVGNPGTRVERSRGGEVGLRYDDARTSLGVAAYRQRLRGEIVETFDSDTFISSTANATGTSRRQGIEVDATYRPSPTLGLSANYAYLDAEEPNVAGDALVREIRRPRHSGSVSADLSVGPLTAGVSIAYVGRRVDTDFGSFPFVSVRLGDYVLGGGRIAYAIVPGVELFGRVSNLFDARYRDVVGYATQGRTVYGGVRFRIGD